MYYVYFLKFISGLSFSKVAAFCLYVAVFVFPFQIRLLIIKDNVFWTGNFNEYLSFFLYLTDILIVMSGIMWGLSYLKNESRLPFCWGDNIFSMLLLLYIFFSVTNIFFMAGGYFQLFFCLRYLEFFVFYLLIVNEVVDLNVLLYAFLISIGLQAFIGFGQYIFQESVGLRILGEPIIGKEIPGVAKINIESGKIVRIYGTFLHPNIFAGALFSALIYAFYLLRQKTWIIVVYSILIAVALILTFSRGAFLSLFVVTIVIYAIAGNRLMNIYLLFIGGLMSLAVVSLDLQEILFLRFWGSNEAILGGERLNYLDISKEMLFYNPFGVGQGGFSPIMQFFSHEKLFPWLIQPVHNIFMLVLTEIGFLGGFLFFSLFIYVFFRLVYLLKNINPDSPEFNWVYVMISILCGYVVMGIFDHYFITSFQGEFMLFFYFSLVSLFMKRFAFPRMKS